MPVPVAEFPWGLLLTLGSEAGRYGEKLPLLTLSGSSVMTTADYPGEPTAVCSQVLRSFTRRFRIIHTEIILPFKPVSSKRKTGPKEAFVLLGPPYTFRLDSHCPTHVHTKAQTGPLLTCKCWCCWSTCRASYIICGTQQKMKIGCRVVRKSSRITKCHSSTLAKHEVF